MQHRVCCYNVIIAASQSIYDRYAIDWHVYVKQFSLSLSLRSASFRAEFFFLLLLNIIDFNDVVCITCCTYKRHSRITETAVLRSRGG